MAAFLIHLSQSFLFSTVTLSRWNNMKPRINNRIQLSPSQTSPIIWYAWLLSGTNLVPWLILHGTCCPYHCILTCISISDVGASRGWDWVMNLTASRDWWLNMIYLTFTNFYFACIWLISNPRSWGTVALPLDHQVLLCTWAIISWLMLAIFTVYLFCLCSEHVKVPSCCCPWYPNICWGKVHW
jgi:hypothetical protein